MSHDMWRCDNKQTCCDCHVKSLASLECLLSSLLVLFRQTQIIREKGHESNRKRIEESMSRRCLVLVPSISNSTFVTSSYPKALSSRKTKLFARIRNMLACQSSSFRTPPKNIASASTAKSSGNKRGNEPHHNFIVLNQDWKHHQSLYLASGLSLPAFRNFPLKSRANAQP